MNPHGHTGNQVGIESQPLRWKGEHELAGQVAISTRRSQEEPATWRSEKNIPGRGDRWGNTGCKPGTKLSEYGRERRPVGCKGSRTRRSRRWRPGHFVSGLHRTECELGLLLSATNLKIRGPNERQQHLLEIKKNSYLGSTNSG